MFKFQPSICSFKMKFKNLLCNVPYATGSKTGPEHDATTTMLDTQYSVPHVYTSSHCGPKVQSLSCHKLFSRGHLAYLFEQLQTSEELEGVDFKAGVSFLVNTLSIHCDVKFTSLWTVMLVFQQFPVLEPRWFSGWAPLSFRLRSIK